MIIAVIIIFMVVRFIIRAARNPLILLNPGRRGLVRRNPWLTGGGGFSGGRSWGGGGGGGFSGGGGSFGGGGAGGKW
jgi:uncharacterized protein